MRVAIAAVSAAARDVDVAWSPGHGPEPLELVCFFSPPVVPGSYEKGGRS